MKLNDSNILTIRIVAVVVLISAAKCIFGEFPIPVGLYSKQFMIFAFASHEESGLKVGSNKFYLFPESETNGSDFIVKFQGKIVSWKNLMELLRQQNFPVTDERSVLAAVHRDKGSRDQSCKHRCFLDERKFRSRTCFCDKACSTFGDCCLDFHLR